MSRRNEDMKVARRYILDNIGQWYGEYSGWKVEGPGKAWVDMRKGSAYLRCIHFFRTSFDVMRETGKYIFMWLAPRHGGKSVTMETEVMRALVEDRRRQIPIIGETKPNAAKRTKWIRGRLAKGKIVTMFGRDAQDDQRFAGFRTSFWKGDEFTIQRPQGEGGDPSCWAVGGRSASTGAHWDIGAFDDVVGLQSNATPAQRNKVIDTFEEYNRQRSKGSVIWIIGTMWGGYQLYRHLIETANKHLVAVIVPAYGPARDQHKKVLWGDEGTYNKLWGRKGVYNYPWIDEEYLLEQRQMSTFEEDFLAQYFNESTPGNRHGVTGEMLKPGSPPTKGGEIDRGKVALYALCDPARSILNVRHTSETAMGVIAKDCKGNVWLVDCRVGKWTFNDSVRILTNMWRRWMPRYVVLENTGPAKGFRDVLQEVKKQEGLEIDVKDVSRHGFEKPERIKTLFSFIENGMLAFAPTLPTDVYTLSGRTTYPRGRIVDAVEGCDFSRVKEIPDVLDMLADAFIRDKDGFWLCPPAPEPEREVPTDGRFVSEAERALRRHLAGGGSYTLPPLE